MTANRILLALVASLMSATSQAVITNPISQLPPLPSLPPGVSCSSNLCSGPAQSLILTVRSNSNATAYVLLAVPNNYLPCSTSVTTVRPIQLASGAAQGSQLALLLSAIATNRKVFIFIDPDSAACRVKELDVQ